MTGKAAIMFELTPAEIASGVEVAERALAEDLGDGGDITSESLFVAENPTVTGLFVARTTGVIAGTAAAAAVFAGVDSPPSVEWQLGDGETVQAGSAFGTVTGLATAVLAGERSALNLLCHLSGIATLTASYVEIVAAINPDCRIRDTRKTTPGLRLLEKAAVRAAGGVNHRLGLFDAALVKDNHLMILPEFEAIVGRVGEGVNPPGRSEPAEIAAPLAESIGRIRRAHPGVEIEIEAETLVEVEAALAAGADVVLCDNMPIDALREAVEIARGRVRIEASGGVNIESLAEVASTGVDFIAVGALTHSAPALDIGLDFRKDLPVVRDSAARAG